MVEIGDDGACQNDFQEQVEDENSEGQNVEIQLQENSDSDQGQGGENLELQEESDENKEPQPQIDETGNQIHEDQNMPQQDQTDQQQHHTATQEIQQQQPTSSTMISLSGFNRSSQLVFGQATPSSNSGLARFGGSGSGKIFYLNI